jgi:hypothetical protein
MPSISIRHILSATFFLIAFTPIFSMIEFRDTTQLPQCDTLIGIDGLSSPVKIKSVTRNSITYTICSDNAKKIFSVSTDKVQEIKSSSFTFVKRQTAPILTRAKRAFRLMGISVLSLLLSIVALIPSFNGDESKNPLLFIFAIALLISPLFIIGGFFMCIDILIKAKKEGNVKAKGLATLGILLGILTFLLLFLLIKG